MMCDAPKEIARLTFDQFQRVVFIDHLLSRNGVVRCEDIQISFGVTRIAAGGDVRTFCKAFPFRLSYDRSVSRYRANGPPVFSEKVRQAVACALEATTSEIKAFRS